MTEIYPGGLMLRVLPDEHRRNFRVLAVHASFAADAERGGAVISTNPSNLLTFYAVEVGLKYLLNKVNKVPFRHEVGKKIQNIEGYSHDILKMIFDLKVPAARIPAPPKELSRCIGGYDDGSGGQSFELAQAHEAWRYGLTVEPADERDIQAYLNGLVTFLFQEIAP